MRIWGRGRFGLVWLGLVGLGIGDVMKKRRKKETNWEELLCKVTVETRDRLYREMDL